jgi:hypothetical protein
MRISQAIERHLAPPSRALEGALLIMALAAATPSSACTITTGVITTALGAYSPHAVAAGVVPALKSRAGLSCSSGVLMLLSGNYIRARYQSRNGLQLLRDGGGGAVGYVLSADPNGTVTAPQSGTIDYMQNNLINALGLLGGSDAELPFYVRPVGGKTPALGSYTDRITIRWDWYLCQGIGLLGGCLLAADSGSATTVVDVTLTVSPRDMVVTMSSSTTWDPINGSIRPKTLPGSKRRIATTLTNPDIVPTDDGITVVVPIDGRQWLALEGDGTPSNIAFAVSTSGGTPISLTYTGAASTEDDVDFSIDGGVSWTHTPTDPTNERAVNAVRLRPRGRLAPGASASLSFPTIIR